MTDVRSQQRALQEKTYALEQRMEHERPHLVRVMYGQPLDRIIVSFDADMIDTVEFDGTPEIAARLMERAGFTSFDTAINVLKSRGAERGKQYSVEHPLPELIGYDHPKVPPEDQEWFDM